MKKVRKTKRYIKKVRERLWSYSIGMRTAKTALSVFLCLLLYYLLERKGVADGSDAFLACTAAVISMQDTIANSINRGLNRLEGTFIGALLGMAALYLMPLIQIDFARFAALAVGIILLIVICNILGRNDAIVMGCVVFLVITLQQTLGSPLISSIYRLLDTAVGIGISVAINHFVHNPDKVNESDDEEDEE
ncbi:MAG: aromatic acid exporter family protein [Clostridiales Family XIII bacterium]|jgi:uncharacterized membrane protein YgaE (UPF0421/DUF939 family)|nr:aromatic acid exporter family protein [Clostridiales Family XIII bacterium]